jgi:hypothetical protein
MKNILAENMLRFGPKNLSESDRIRLQRLMEATETVDMSAVNTAFNNLNSLIKSIPNRNKQDKKYELTAYEKYFDYGYNIQLIKESIGTYNRMGDGKLEWSVNTKDFDTDTTMMWYYDRDAGPKYNSTSTTSKLITPGLGIALFKSNVSAGGESTKFKSGVWSTTKQLINTNIENLKLCANYVNKKDYSAAVDMIDKQIKPAVQATADALADNMQTWPAGKAGELTWSESGYTLTFSDPEESESKTGSLMPK